MDWVAAPDWKIEKMTVDRGILREIEAMLNIIQSLLKCDVGLIDPDIHSIDTDSFAGA